MVHLLYLDFFKYVYNALENTYICVYVDADTDTYVYLG